MVSCIPNVKVLKVLLLQCNLCIFCTQLSFAVLYINVDIASCNVGTDNCVHCRCEWRRDGLRMPFPSGRVLDI